MTVATAVPRQQNRAAAAFEYEFGGPIGATLTTLALPLVVLVLAHWSDVGRVDFAFLSASLGDTTNSHDPKPFWQIIRQNSVLCPRCNDSDSVSLLLRCALGVVAWFLFQVLLERFLPCELVQGSPVKGDAKNRLTYRINGHLAFWVTLLLVHAAWPVWDANAALYQFTTAPLATLYKYYTELAFVTILLSAMASTGLYLDSFRGQHKILADGGDSGNVLYDFFIGRELNPRIGTFDWKEFCELRPGLIGWVLLNIACAKQQYSVLGYVTGSMILVNVFHGIYVWDALYQERAILTTMDITTDGFGFMLLFGDLAWVPFTYSLQARYLVKHDPNLSAVSLAGIIALHILGYLIFRGANGQKDAFRRNPTDPALSHLTFLQTKRGTKLLTSGWWGMARKINYTGDWIMGLTWCMVCGFDSAVPYFYAVYFFILLVHRSIRDDHMCSVKYGDDWETYKSIVPHRFVPGVV
jgi:delta14-sterol reductase/lamin-B receptor